MLLLQDGLTGRVLGVVSYDADGPPVEPPEANDDVLGVHGLDLKEVSLIHNA